MYIKYIFRTILRSIAIGWNHPKVVSAWVFTAFNTIPGFKFSVKLPDDRFQKRNKDRDDGKPTGWNEFEKFFTLSLMGMTVLKFRISDEYQLNLHNFFFKRKARQETGFALEKFRENGFSITFSPRIKVFEPGCNAGKFLYYFIDYYGAEGVGVDIFKSAIDIAKKANIFNDAEFYVSDLVKSDFLSRFSENHFDLTVVSSHFIHVSHFGEFFEKYVSRIVMISKEIIVMERYDPLLENILHKNSFKIFSAGTADLPLIYAYLKK